jgi:hypothetical protein
MSIAVLSARDLAHVAVFFGAAVADLALVSTAHAAAFNAWYGTTEAEPITVAEIAAEVSQLRAKPYTLDRDRAFRSHDRLTYNARTNDRDWTAEQPWSGAFQRIGRAVGKKLRELRRGWEGEHPAAVRSGKAAARASVVVIGDR